MHSAIGDGDGRFFAELHVPPEAMSPAEARAALADIEALLEPLRARVRATSGDAIASRPPLASPALRSAASGVGDRSTPRAAGPALAAPPRSGDLEPADPSTGSRALEPAVR